jgi:hypothetical protein
LCPKIKHLKLGTLNFLAKNTWSFSYVEENKKGAMKGRDCWWGDGFYLSKYIYYKIRLKYKRREVKTSLLLMELLVLA